MTVPKSRTTYVGRWNQDEAGAYSFVFEDGTIPVGLTKIDGVLYAFTGYGQLKDGFEYRTGHKTGADGIVREDSQEFFGYSQPIPARVHHKSGISRPLRAENDSPLFLYA